MNDMTTMSSHYGDTCIPIFTPCTPNCEPVPSFGSASFGCGGTSGSYTHTETTLSGSLTFDACQETRTFTKTRCGGDTWYNSHIDECCDLHETWFGDGGACIPKYPDPGYVECS